MQHSSLLSYAVSLSTDDRSIKKVPFVELYNNRIQGVVSSGSDIERVYVSFIEAGSLDFYCSTNNNRPCGGLNGNYLCNHLQALLEEANSQFGLEKLIRYLKFSGDPTQIQHHWQLVQKPGNLKKEPASEVFSRFLNYLRYLELQGSDRPLPEMAWFI